MDTVIFADACAAVEQRKDGDLIEALDRHDIFGHDTLNTVTALHGMTLLHIAAGTNNLSAARMLVERGAKFLLDKQNRMPSIVAVEAEADEDLCDYLAEQEEVFLKREALVTVLQEVHT
jgi:ankyrin repeat protein